jgi:large subunit ribosomal protein L10
MKKVSQIIKEVSETRIKESIKKSNSFLIVKYSGVSSPDMCNLRMALRSVDAEMFVVKNTTARRAVKEFNIDALSGMVEGPCGFIFFKEGPVAASKVLAGFKKDHEKLVLEGGLLDDKVLTTKDIEKMSKLPSKEVLRAQVVMTLKSPIFGIVGVLKGNLRKLVWCMEQIKQKKESQPK